MNTPLKLTALTGAVLLSACQSANSNTVYCDDKAVGSKFEHNGMIYLVADDQSIRNDNIKQQLFSGKLRVCTSHVTDLSLVFYDAQSFNHPIGDWDVSNVTTMKGLFFHAHQFNQPIGHWDVSNVESMEMMFYEARHFNQSIADWDVSQVENMNLMFAYASDFNQPLDNWAKKPTLPWE